MSCNSPTEKRCHPAFILAVFLSSMVIPISVADSKKNFASWQQASFLVEKQNGCSFFLRFIRMLFKAAVDVQ